MCLLHLYPLGLLKINLELMVEKNGREFMNCTISFNFFLFLFFFLSSIILVLNEKVQTFPRIPGIRKLTKIIHEYRAKKTGNLTWSTFGNGEDIENFIYISVYCLTECLKNKCEFPLNENLLLLGIYHLKRRN